LVPELLLIGLSSLATDLNLGETKSFQDALSSLEVLSLLDETKLGVEICSERGTTVEVNIVAERGSI
jgi:hypothetical protein